jgi:hypothetical protein
MRRDVESAYLLTEPPQMDPERQEVRPRYAGKRQGRPTGEVCEATS